MILLLLALLWIAVLAPGVIRKRAERRSATSIDSFHRELHLLERTGPKITPPAHRLQSVPVPGESGSGLPAITSRPDRPKLVLVSRGGAAGEVAETATAGYGWEGTGSGDGTVSFETTPFVPDGFDGARSNRSTASGRSGMTSRRPSDAYQRRQAAKRRRDIFLALVGTIVVTGFLGLVHSLRLLWVVTVLSVLALAAYVALISYARRLQIERQEADRTRRLRTAGRSGAVGDELGSYRETQWRGPVAGWGAASAPVTGNGQGGNRYAEGHAAADYDDDRWAVAAR